MRHGKPVTGAGAGALSDPGDVGARAGDGSVEQTTPFFDLSSIRDIDDERLWI